MAKFTITNTKDLTGSTVNNFFSVGRDVLIAFGISFVLLFALAMLLTYSDIPESFIAGAVLAITVISNIFGGFLTARGADNKGWLHGSIGGLVYMIILYILRFSLTGMYNPINLVGMLATGFFAGAFGGILGINISKSRLLKNKKRS